MGEIERAIIQTARDQMKYFMLAFAPSDYIMAGVHRVICDRMDALRRNEIQNLMIMMPPQNGKTEIATRKFPAFFLGHYPETCVISTSYNSKKACHESVKCKSVMGTPLYKHMFPRTRIAIDGAEYWTTTAGGQCIAGGAGSGQTGEPGHLIIIDDPYKGRQEAESETIQGRVWDWYTGVISTRQHEGITRKLLICTPWTPRDLCFRILEIESDKWTVLKFPAIAGDRDPLGRKPGEPLFPEKFSLEWLAEQRKLIGTYDWLSLYQCEPIPRSGIGIKREYVRIISRAEYEKIQKSKTVTYWDLAVSTGSQKDYTAGLTMGFDSFKWADTNIYIENVRRHKEEWSTTLKIIAEHSKARKYDLIGIEGAGTQKGLYDTIHKELIGLNICKIDYPVGDKKVRALPWVAKAEAGKFFCVEGPYLEEYLSEIECPGKNDDQWDATSGATKMFEQGSWRFSK